MRKLSIVIAGATLGGTVAAENLDGVDELICASSQVQICIEDDSCYSTSAVELGIPDFVVIDTKKKTIRTTDNSYEKRSSKFHTVSRQDGLISLQGSEGARWFSFVIHEATGRLTAAVARDGMTVSVFGACTSTDI